jgi:hypothetical protein
MITAIKILILVLDIWMVVLSLRSGESVGEQLRRKIIDNWVSGKKADDDCLELLFCYQVFAMLTIFYVFLNASYTYWFHPSTHLGFTFFDYLRSLGFHVVISFSVTLRYAYGKKVKLKWLYNLIYKIPNS